jgi:hypothetical protein
MSPRFRKGFIVGLALAASKLAAAGSEPSMTVLPGTAANCAWWYDHNGFLSCTQVLQQNWISLDEFRQWVCLYRTLANS